MPWQDLTKSILTQNQLPLLNDQFTLLGKHKKTVNLIAFENSIVKLAKKQKILNLSLNEYFSSQNNEIVISGKVFQADEAIIKKWRSFLQQKIFYSGFHENFQVYRTLGKGSQGTVFHARSLFDQNEYAIKAFSKKYYEHIQNGKQGILTEIKCLQLLNHPNILKFKGVYETQNTIYLALEYLSGGSLSERLTSSKKLSQENIKIILRGILKGVQYMHAKNIMHRDLKVENILFKNSNYDSLVIADFGYATQIGNTPYIFQQCGTPGYMAPEIINQQSQSYDSKCDIFSVGVIFYLLLTGKRLFFEKGTNNIFKLNEQANINFNLAELSEVPKEAIDLLKMLLKKHPSERFSAKDALKHNYFRVFNQVDNLESSDEEDDDNPQNNIEQLNENPLKIQTIASIIQRHTSSSEEFIGQNKVQKYLYDRIRSTQPDELQLLYFDKKQLVTKIQFPILEQNDYQQNNVYSCKLTTHCY